MKVSDYKVKDLAEKYRIPVKKAKTLLDSLLKKVNDFHLYAAYLDQAA